MTIRRKGKRKGDKVRPRRRSPSVTAFTYSDYCLLPDNGNRYEIIEGDLYNAPAPFVRHQDILRNLGAILERYCSKNRHGKLLYAPTDVVLSNIDIVQPDILWISNERMSIVTEKNIQGMPDLTVEIISPRTKEKDEQLKLKLYRKFKVREYWLIDPEMQVFSVYRRSGKVLKLKQKYSEIEEFESKLFPELRIDLSRVFAR